MKSKQYSLRKDYTISTSDATTLIIPTARENSGCIFEIDSMGAQILTLLKKKATLEQVVTKIAKQYPPEELKNIKKYTGQFLQQLAKKQIIDELP